MHGATAILPPGGDKQGCKPARQEALTPRDGGPRRSRSVTLVQEGQPSRRWRRVLVGRARVCSIACAPPARFQVGLVSHWESRDAAQVDPHPPTAPSVISLTYALPTRTKGTHVTTVYLAGKVTKNDWRHQVVEGLQYALNAYALGGRIGAQLPEEEFFVLGKARYSGPFFIGCDHGCAHGESSHGNAVGPHGPGCITTGPTRAEVAKRSRDGIAQADHVFAWIDDLTAYGTLVEVGLAAGMGKPVWLYTSPHKDHDDLWFTRYAVGHGTVAHAATPLIAVDDFISKVAP